MTTDNHTEKTFIAGERNGPTIWFHKNRGHVVITWDNPLDDYTKHRSVTPPITTWDELDAVCYSIGRDIIEHFFGK